MPKIEFNLCLTNTHLNTRLGYSRNNTYYIVTTT